MAQTSIHICPVKPGSEKHNLRLKELDYVNSKLTPENKSWNNPDYPCIDEQTKRIKADYLAAHGKKLHANATPIREAVVVIQEDTTIEQLKEACKQCEEKFGIKAMQIYLHRDEGYLDENKVWHKNLHAHIVFDWYDEETHTTHKLNRQDMAEMQNIFAECLKMQRGESSDRKHLNSIQQKNKAEAERLERIQKEIHTLEDKKRVQEEQIETYEKQLENYNQTLLQACKDLRKSGDRTVKAFDKLCNFDAVKPTPQEQEHRDNLERECKRDLPSTTTELAEHSQSLRLHLMHTIEAVTRIGVILQNLASKIPILKRNKLAHEAELQAKVAAAEQKEKEAAEATKKAAEATKEAQAKENLVLQRELTLQAKINAAEQDTKKRLEIIWQNTVREKYAPAIAERDTLKQELDEEMNFGYNTAMELIRAFGAEPFEKKGLEFTKSDYWEDAKKKIQKDTTKDIDHSTSMHQSHH